MREKENTEKGYVFQRWTWNAQIVKRVSKSQKIGGKGYSNHYDQSYNLAIIRGKVGKLRQHVH